MTSPNSAWLVVLVIAPLLFFIGSVPIIISALVISNWFKRVPCRWALALAHAVIVVLCMAMYKTDIFCPPGPFDDVYASYLFVPGIHIYWLIQAFLSAPFWQRWLHGLPFHTASLLEIVFIPGVVGALVGSVQWYLLGSLLERTRFGKRVYISRQ